MKIPWLRHLSVNILVLRVGKLEKVTCSKLPAHRKTYGGFWFCSEQILVVAYEHRV